MVDELTSLYEQAVDIAVFDFDGTMTYTEDLHWNYYYKLLKTLFNVDYPFPEHKETTGMRMTEALEYLGNKYGFDGNDNRIFEYKKIHPHSIATELIELDRPAYTFLKPCVERLFNNGSTIVCVSANDIQTISESLVRWDISQYFSAVYSVVARNENKSDIVHYMVRDKTAVVFDDAEHVMVEHMNKTPHMLRVAISHPFSRERFENNKNAYNFLVNVESECGIINEAKKIRRIGYG